jgi:hypothetical protein
VNRGADGITPTAIVAIDTAIATAIGTVVAAPTAATILFFLLLPLPLLLHRLLLLRLTTICWGHLTYDHLGDTLGASYGHLVIITLGSSWALLG